MPEKIVIPGGGTARWMAANLFIKKWSADQVTVTLIESLEATALLLVQISIELFIAKFEQGNFGAEYRDEFNQKVHERFERVRDYIVAH